MEVYVIIRLNPCFSGLYYLTFVSEILPYGWYMGLNPCFSGLYYLTTNLYYKKQCEEGLNPCFSGLYYLTPRRG